MCNLKTQQIIIIVLILIIIFLYFYNKNENIEENKQTSEMYIPNCNMLNDEDVCTNTRGCFYDNGCYYDWINLQ
jgi:hypothetical protein